MIGIWLALVVAAAIAVGIISGASWTLVKRLLGADQEREKARERWRQCLLGVFAIGTTVLSAWLISSVTVIRADQVGVAEYRFWPGWKPLPPGRFIARDGELGLQAKLLEPGIRFRPAIFSTVTVHPLQEIPQGAIGIVESLDGRPLPQDAETSPHEWDTEGWYEPRSFLSSPNSYRGIQRPPLRPGKHRLHPHLFRVIEVDTTLRVVRFGKGESDIQRVPEMGRLEEIQTTADGTNLNAHVRVNYRVTPDTAYLAIAQLGSDFEDKLLELVQSTSRTTVRAVIQPLQLFELMDNRVEHEREIKSRMTDALSPYGVILDLVAFTSIYPPDGEEGNAFRSLLEQRSRQEQDAEQAAADQANEKYVNELNEMRLKSQQSEQRAEEERVRHAIEMQRLQDDAEAESERRRGEIAASNARQLAEAEAEGVRLLAEYLGQAGAALVIAVRDAARQGIDLFPDVVVPNSGSELPAYLLDRFDSQAAGNDDSAVSK